MDTQLEISHGEGPYLVATDGKRYLDMATGIAVNALGYGHPEVLSAIDTQIHRHLHLYGGTAYQEPVVAYAEALIEEIGDDVQIFFGNSGTEAVEAAIKLARFATKRPGIIAFRGAFHGRTLGAVSLTASAAKYRSAYEPLLPSVYHIDYPAPTRLGLSEEAALAHVQTQMEALLSLEVAPSSVALIVVEAVQGEGGYIIPPAGFLPWLRSLTEQNGILLAIDEVQSGFGRTGKMFAYQHTSIQPDLVIMGKALGGGLPLSALSAPRALMESWPAGTHGTTFGGNPVSCAAGLATLNVIRRDGLVARSAELGRDAMERLSRLQGVPGVRDVRALGLMIGVEFSGERAADIVEWILEQGLEEGLLLHPAGLKHEVVRLMPPMNIDRTLFLEAVEHFARLSEQALMAIQTS